MKTFAPNYYRAFRCIADKCRHSCCIGWDVYIDEETLEKYKTLGGETGKRVRAHLCRKEDGVCFEMCESGRCPMLNERGLCDIILANGEGYISEICTEHPRFYNFFSDRTEVGLGLSCEEAARIMLSQKEKTELTAISEDSEEEYELYPEEEYVLSKRAEIFDVLQNRKAGITERARKMLALCHARFPEKSVREWAQIFRGLEMLDGEWEESLALLEKSSFEAEIAELDTAFEKLLIYFVYRHTAKAESEADFAARICFAYLSFSVIRALCAAKKEQSGVCSFDDLCELARRYSAEIEYSEENTETLISIIEE
jgi:lysine-N-methylase